MSFAGPATEAFADRVRSVRSLAIVVVAAILVIAACAPADDGPIVGGSAAPGSALPSGLVPGQATVTLNGTSLQIVGLGTATTPEFDLPPGTAEVKLGKCASNQVPPFVQMYDENNTGLGFIVEEVNEVKNLAGGKYYLAVQANPSCVWAIEVTPK
jgi:hypothetical protein